MTALFTEKALEDEICGDLAATGWRYYPTDAAGSASMRHPRSPNSIHTACLARLARLA